MPILFSPLNIGGMKLENRIVMPGLTSNFASEAGEVTEQLIAYLEARAKGEVGLILVESAITDLSGRGGPRQLGIYHDSLIPGLSRLTKAIHKYETKVGIQIVHGGRQMTSQFSGMQPVAASAIACPVIGVTPRELEIHEIEEHTIQFADAAERAVKAGFDCIEFVASHGYLISGFLSPYSNRRTDEYGGTFEGRVRFLKEIVLKTQERIGDTFPIIVRINASEYVEGGIEIEDAKRISKLLEELGVHCIDVSVSVKASYHHLSASAGEPYANQTKLAAEIKQTVKIPVITAGRILEYSTAEEILENQQADFIAFGRALIAEPNLVKKMKSEDKLVIPCISCNACNQRTRRPQIICVVNSDTGREYRVESTSDTLSKKVAVVGGGLAGLEAARIAAQNGHDVTLYTDGPLGGLTYYRSLVPGMEEFVKSIEYFGELLRRLNVKIVNESLYPNVSNEFQMIFDASWLPFGTPVDSVDSHIRAIEVLQGKGVGQRVVLTDDGLLACETALYLARRGKRVTIRSEEEKHIRDAHPTIAFYLEQRLRKAGVDFSRSLLDADTYVVPHGFGMNRPDRYGNTVETIVLGDAYESSDLAEKVAKAGELSRTL